MVAKLLMKTLLLLTTVFKLVSPPILVPPELESVKAAAVVPSLAVPLAIAVTSFNWKEYII